MASNPEFLTKEELEAIDYRHLVKMDSLYSFKSRRRTIKTKKTKNAIVERLFKIGVPRSKYKADLAAYLHYELTHPIATKLPIYLVGDIYTMKQELEDKDYEIAFIKNIFEATNKKPFNMIYILETIVQNHIITIYPDEAKMLKHISNLGSPNFFIKDYKYLVKKFGITAKKLYDNAEYRDTKGFELERYQHDPKEGIYNSYASFKKLHLQKFFGEHIISAYVMYAVIDEVLESLEDYFFTHKVIDYSLNISMLEYKERYLPFAHQNVPITILQVYIDALNNKLKKLSTYKITLNSSIIKALNKRLDNINVHLVKRDYTIMGQNNALFTERIIDYANVPHSYTLKKQRSIRLQQRKSF
jgi:hypothetical protein